MKISLPSIIVCINYQRAKTPLAATEVSSTSIPMYTGREMKTMYTGRAMKPTHSQRSLMKTVIRLEYTINFILEAL